MPLPSLNLDDRRFADLVDEARRYLRSHCPEWSDPSPSDPGTVLLEAFAFMTEAMIYRLNRLPEKAYLEFLNLLGVTLQPPAAASTVVQFQLAKPLARGLEIPRGTRVALGRAAGGGEPVVFATASAASIAAGETLGSASAFHVEMVDAELAGHGTGRGGLSVVARRPPIVAPTGTRLDLVVGVETPDAELDDRGPAVTAGGKTYRIWRQVDHFSNVEPDAPVYVADRATGTITFAPELRLRHDGATLSERPEALAAVPPLGREIRLWYWRGGGNDGNVAAGTLTTLKDPIAGVAVVNLVPAVGGRSAETLDNARGRGPREFRTLERAVTAGDFELIAETSSGAVGRARAFTQAALWTHATPGTVEVVLVPHGGGHLDPTGPLAPAQLASLHSASARERIHAVLDERKPLGTSVVVSWAHYKAVKVRVRLVAYREEDTAALRARILARLYRLLNPLGPSWRFGQTLRASHVYDILLGEPGVSYVEDVRFEVAESPDRDVRCIAADARQPRTWYAGTGGILFRTLNGGDGWEAAGRFGGESVERVAAHPTQAGMVAVVTQPAQGGGSACYVSRDCGESWQPPIRTAFEIADLAWLTRDGEPALLLATRVGLYTCPARPDATPVQILVDRAKAGRGVFAIAVATDARGDTGVAVAMTELGGVFWSKDGGRLDTFAPIGLAGEDVRVLAVQRLGTRLTLWAGFAAIGGEAGKGAASLDLVDLDPVATGWERRSRGWADADRRPGSCWALAAHGAMVFAGSNQGGVLTFDASRPDAAWQAPPIDCGLPHREVERIFQRLDAIAVDASTGVLMAAGPGGISRSVDRGVSYVNPSAREQATQRVTLPETWLLTSSEHEVVVETGDDSRRD